MDYLQWTVLHVCSTQANDVTVSIDDMFEHCLKGKENETFRHFVWQLCMYYVYIYL